ncbi:hypothetical protein Mgra_00005784 [Meloidogyne graminicola]|uniref:Uncharacterized protein n=1 Tax=Meloidogyne graminicola TaxID=189291 RepID=A0A8S9ZMV6_9BILA|nr:hypothetical protein Mgra_00005784 [Meloidogyne graminicola]
MFGKEDKDNLEGEQNIAQLLEEIEKSSLESPDETEEMEEYNNYNKIKENKNKLQKINNKLIINKNNEEIIPKNILIETEDNLPTYTHLMAFRPDYNIRNFASFLRQIEATLNQETNTSRNATEENENAQRKRILEKEGKETTELTTLTTTITITDEQHKEKDEEQDLDERNLINENRYQESPPIYYQQQQQYPYYYQNYRPYQQYPNYYWYCGNQQQQQYYYYYPNNYPYYGGTYQQPLWSGGSLPGNIFNLGLGGDHSILKSPNKKAVFSAYSIINGGEQLEYDDKMSLYYLIGSFCFMIVSNVIWALVRFCLVVPRNRKIQQLEQHYKLLEVEYKSERILMSSKKETSISSGSKTDRVLSLNFCTDSLIEALAKLVVTSSEASRSSWSNVPSSLKSEKAMINVKPVAVSPKKTSPIAPKRQPVKKEEQGPILVSENSNYEEIGNLDDIYSFPSKAPDKSVKSAKLFSDEMTDAVPFSMLSDGGRGIPFQPTQISKASKKKKSSTPQSTEESTEEEKGPAGKGKTNSSSSESEEDIYKLKGCK